MARCSLSYILIVVHIIQYIVKSSHNTCWEIKSKTLCNEDEFSFCNWNLQISSCICNINNNTNSIYLLDASLPFESISGTILSISANTNTLNQIIPYQQQHIQNPQKNTKKDTNINFQSAINKSISIFSSHHDVNHHKMQNILIIIDNHNNFQISPSTQTKLNNLNIDTVRMNAAYNPQNIASKISCKIQTYQQQKHLLSVTHLKLSSQRKLVETSPIKTCCQCLTSNTSPGCPADRNCESRVCTNDQSCCKKSVGWDDACVFDATAICNAPPTLSPTDEPIQETLPAPPPKPVDEPIAPSYNTCWEIESPLICNDDYYMNELGCHWDTNDESCMCSVGNTPINMIYLVDISLSAAPTDTHYYNVAHLIHDVTQSTLTNNINAHNQILLYDENVYIQKPDKDPTTIDIADNNKFPRTQTTDLLNAINTAVTLFQFDLLGNNNKPVLVIFNGGKQSDYTQDPATICEKKSELTTLGISVIITSYTVNAAETERNLQCLVSELPVKADAYNSVSYETISGAAAPGWNGNIPIEAKLSWDICDASTSITEKPTTFKPSISTKQPFPPSMKVTKVIPICNLQCAERQLLDPKTCSCHCLIIQCDVGFIFNDNLCLCQPVPTPKPTLKPTLKPTHKPSPFPLQNTANCILHDDLFEFVILMDNSCGLSQNNCHIQLEMIGELLSSIKQDNIGNNNNNPLVSYIEYNSNGAEVVVSFNDIIYQENIQEFVGKIRNDGKCTDGTLSPQKTDLATGLEIAVRELMINGNPHKSIQKIITINNCENTERMDEVCGSILDELNENDINVYAINIASSGSFYQNYRIKQPKEYIMCLVNGNKNRICSAEYLWNEIDADIFINAIQECIGTICDKPTPFPSPHPILNIIDRDSGDSSDSGDSFGSFDSFDIDVIHSGDSGDSDDSFVDIICDGINRECNDGIHIFDINTCSCQCPVHSSQCPGNQIYFDKVCKCECSVLITCVANSLFDPIQCQCIDNNDKLIPSPNTNPFPSRKPTFKPTFKPTPKPISRQKPRKQRNYQFYYYYYLRNRYPQNDGSDDSDDSWD